MNPAQGYRELVAHLQSHRARLGEPQMMRVGGVSAADQTRLGCHEFEVGFIAQPARLTERQLAFVDFAGARVGLLKYRWVALDR